MSRFRKVVVVVTVVVLAFMAIGATVVFAAPDGLGIGNEGECDPVRPPIDRELVQQIFDREAIKAIIADTLGLTVEELEAAREAGIGLQQLAEEQGVALEDIRAAVKAYKEEAIQAALDEELITEAQAEWLLAHDGRPSRFQIRRRVAHLLRNIIDLDVMKETAATPEQ